MSTSPLPTPVSTSIDTDDRLLARLAAPAALGAGVLLVITQVVQLVTLDRDDLQATLTDPVYKANAVAQFVVFWFLIVVPVAAHQWHARRAGTLAAACLRAKVFPAGISIALIVGAVLGIQMVQPPLGIPLGLALVWLGAWMLRRHP
jgi:hypothetical protein